MKPRKLSYRAAVSQALELTKAENWRDAAVAWVNAAEAAGRYESGNREMCGREAVRAFNTAYIEPIEITALRSLGNEISLPGTSLEVLYWPMAREGEGKRGRTQGAAYMLCGTAVIGIEGVAGCIALSHVFVIEEKS